MTDTWFSSVEAMVYIGYKKTKFYELLKAKQIAAYKKGRLWHFKKSDLDKFLARSRVA